MTFELLEHKNIGFLEYAFKVKCTPSKFSKFFGYKEHTKVLIDDGTEYKFGNGTAYKTEDGGKLWNGEPIQEWLDAERFRRGFKRKNGKIFDK